MKIVVAAEADLRAPRETVLKDRRERPEPIRAVPRRARLPLAGGKLIGAQRPGSLAFTTLSHVGS
jgi:hypothetical protein